MFYKLFQQSVIVSGVRCRRVPENSETLDLKRQFIGTALLVVGFAGCSGGGGSKLPEVDPAEVTIQRSDSTLTFAADDIDATLALAPENNRGTFVSARFDGSDTPVRRWLSVSETENSFAAILIERDADSYTTTEPFFGRSAAFDNTQTGTATLTGTYIGHRSGGDFGDLLVESGDLTLDLDFIDMTIAGTVENIMFDLPILDTALTVGRDESILLLETDISASGRFAGQTRTIENETGETVGGASYGGVIASGEALEVVGTISRNGIFAAGH